MKPRHFLVSLLAINLSFHILRFPHLIIENGGGAFLILFFIVLNALALPLLITESVLENKLREIDLKSLISIHKIKGPLILDQIFVIIWYGARLTILLFILWFFLYLSGTSFVYLTYFSGFLLGTRVNIIDLPAVPTLELDFWGALLISAFAFFLNLRFRKRFFHWSNQWVLPVLFSVLLFLFLKIILAVKDFEALKILFYPDFSALTRNSLMNSIGHSMIGLFVGFGFYGRLKGRTEESDLIEIFIHALIQTLCLAVVIGVTALPMIQQVSETAFGSNWVFSILPRWLSYGDFGNYYCSLFFLCIAFLGLHMSVVVYDLIAYNTALLLDLKKNSTSRFFINSLFVCANAGVVFLFQKFLQGWSGQSYYLMLDHIIIDRVLPILGLMMIWVVFRYTKKSEQLQIFAYQQVFYHNQMFFKIWRVFCFAVVPGLVVTAWAISFLFRGN